MLRDVTRAAAEGSACFDRVSSASGGLMMSSLQAVRSDSLKKRRAVLTVWQGFQPNLQPELGLVLLASLTAPSHHTWKFQMSSLV